MEDTKSSTQLNKNVWIPPKFRKIGTDTHSITKNVFKVWDILYRQEKWEYNSPLIPLAGTNFFPPGNKTRMGRHLGTKKLGEVVTQGKIRSRNDLQTQEGVQHITDWEYFQLIHFVSTLPQPIREDTTLNPIEKLCCIGKPEKT